jgi:hypothetical protein
MTDVLKQICEDRGINPELPLYELCDALLITIEKTRDEGLSVHLPVSVLSNDYLLRGKLCQEIEDIYEKQRQHNKDKQSFLPSDWTRAIEALKSRKKPKNIKDERWQTLIERLDRLVEQETDHLLKMVEYDWPLQEVFGCYKFAPDVRIDGMGLLMLLHDSSIAEIAPNKAILRHKGGATTSYTLGAFKGGRECSTLMDID